MNIDIVDSVDGQKLECAFCHRGEKNASYLFYSDQHKLYICNICIHTMYHHNVVKTTEKEPYSPEQICSMIKEYVIGQDDAIKSIAVVLFKHLFLSDHATHDYFSKIKSNAMIIGPTGVGKTMILEVASKLFDIPMILVDATLVTATGYVGDDIESVLSRLVKKANMNISKAEKGIIFLDEIDKITRKEMSGTHRDISGESVQQEFLRLLEGSKIEVSLDSRKTNFSRTASIDTSNMLFVSAGCFFGIDKKLRAIEQFDSGNQLLNYKGKQYSTSMAINLRNSIVDYGLLPEFASRFSTVVMLKSLSKQDILNIIMDARGKVKSYFALFDAYNITVDVQDGVYDVIADYALRLEIGARGVNYIADLLFNSYVYNINAYTDKSVTISIEEAEKLINQFSLIKNC